MNNTFPTIFGRNLLEELANFAAPPFLIITMAELWPLLSKRLDNNADFAVYYVEDTKEETLINQLSKIGDRYCCFVGVGGGQAIDVAKYFSWRTGKPLFQFPTILSVDAMYGQRSGVRIDGNVRYKGWAIPESLFFDFDVINQAPKELNYSGIGDILCFHTAVLDWKLAHAAGKCSPQWPYNEQLALVSSEKVDNLLQQQQQIHSLSDAGIRCMVDAFQWGGYSYFSSGWCPCHVEGYEHFFFYVLEKLTGKKFLHGKPVCLGVYIGSLLHQQRAAEMLAAIARIGLDIRPQSMGISWNDVADALYAMKDYVHQQNLWYSIAHQAEIDSKFVNLVQENVEQCYFNWK